MKNTYTPLLLSVISIVMSFILLIYMCYNGGCFSIQSINFGDAAVSSLGVIVTILIGWNIYKVIEDKDKIKKEVLEDVNKELTKSQYRFYNSFITEEITLANIFIELKDWKNALPFLSLMGKRYKWIADDYDNSVDFSLYISTVSFFIDKINDEFIKNSELRGFMEGVFYELAKYDKKVVDTYKKYIEKYNNTHNKPQIMSIASNGTK